MVSSYSYLPRSGVTQPEIKEEIGRTDRLRSLKQNTMIYLCLEINVGLILQEDPTK
jgi:hypothetical protein